MARPKSLLRATFFAVALLAFAFSGANAQSIETKAREAILIDYQTGAVLLDKNADALTDPASMTKMMTVYLLFERLKDGSLTLQDTLPVSEKAWRKGGSKMFVEVDSQVTVEDILRGIMVQSGNDAAIVVAEALGGSEEAFARQMTDKARELGMESSLFRNATGWPDPEHVVTVRDLATLAKATLDNFPDFYKIYAEREFTYNGIRQYNRNPLLGRSAGADGLKTGFTDEAGYGLTASAERDGRRLILVVNGLESVKDRRIEAQKLMDWGFREFDNYALFAAGETVTEAAVWLGELPSVPLVVDTDVLLTLQRKARRDMKVRVVYDGPVPAPIEQGQELARLRIEFPDGEARDYPLRAGAPVAQLGLVGRLAAALKYIVWGARG